MADFDYRHTGAQLSIFFAGPILATDLSKQYRTKYRLAADLALSALPGENRVYNGNVENTAEEIWAWEQTIGGRASWQATSHFSATAFTYLAYDIYRRTSDTSTAYEPPRNGLALLPGLQLRLTDKGYLFTADGTRGQRLDWRAFGYSSSTSRPQSAYTLYDADLNKDYYIRKFTKGGWDLAYFGGDQLDRFSRHSRRHGFLRRHRHEQRSLWLQCDGSDEVRGHVQLCAVAQPGRVQPLQKVRWPGGQLQHRRPQGNPDPRHRFLRFGRKHCALQLPLGRDYHGLQAIQMTAHDD
jgi:hypothetical protein